MPICREKKRLNKNGTPWLPIPRNPGDIAMKNANVSIFCRGPSVRLTDMICWWQS